MVLRAGTALLAESQACSGAPKDKVQVWAVLKSPRTPRSPSQHASLRLHQQDQRRRL